MPESADLTVLRHIEFTTRWNIIVWLLILEFAPSLHRDALPCFPNSLHLSAIICMQTLYISSNRGCICRGCVNKIVIFLFFRHLVTAAMTFVLNQTILNIKEEYVIHLLKAYPLLHLLRGDCVPNEQTIFRPSAIKWTELTDPLRRTELHKESVFYVF